MDPSLPTKIQRSNKLKKYNHGNVLVTILLVCLAILAVVTMAEKVSDAFGKLRNENTLLTKNNQILLQKVDEDAKTIKRLKDISDIKEQVVIDTTNRNTKTEKTIVATKKKRDTEQAKQPPTQVQLSKECNFADRANIDAIWTTFKDIKAGDKK